jgi:hypothetical protein
MHYNAPIQGAAGLPKERTSSDSTARSRAWYSFSSASCLFRSLSRSSFSTSNVSPSVRRAVAAADGYNKERQWPAKHTSQSSA